MTNQELRERIAQFAIEINELHIAHVEDGDDLYKGNFHEAVKQIISLEVQTIIADRDKEMRKEIWKEFVSKIDNIAGEFGDNPSQFLSILDEHLHGKPDVEY